MSQSRTATHVIRATILSAIFTTSFRTVAGMVDVVPYDPAWPERASRAIAEVRAALDGVALEIEHIGSTAVPGLDAKPVIDLMLAVAELRLVAERADRLVAIGFQPVESIPGRLLFVRPGTHHLHVVTAPGWDTRNQRLLRDHLRGADEDRARYADLKHALAAGGLSPEEYTRAKTELIQEMTDRARAARGLPPAPVWED